MKKHLLVIFFAITLPTFYLTAQSISSDGISFPKTQSLTIKKLIEMMDVHYDISYQDQLIPFNKQISLQKGFHSTTSLMAKICRGNGLRFDIEGDQVFISEKKQKVSKQKRSNYVTLSGSITNSRNGEAVIGAYIAGEGDISSISNSYGFFSITVPRGAQRFSISHASFEDLERQIDLKENLSIKLTLDEKIDKLPEVVISGRQPKENITGIIPGVNTLTFKNEGEIPYFLGEVDVLQSSLLLPGITNLGEDSNGINIRGGSTSQNLILLDEAVIFNSSHFYGLISVFNPESVNDVEIFKGSLPARFGGRNASVINIRQREGNDKNINVAGGIGLVAGRLTVEGPLVKDKSSFLVSARRSLLNLALEKTGFTSLGDGRASFEDINFKVNLKANPKNRFFLSGYYGNDRTETGLETFRKWGNRSLTGRWNHLFNDRLFLNTSLVFSEYTYRVTDLREAGSFQGTSEIINYDLKFDFSYFFNKNQLATFGGGLNSIKSNPGDRLPLPESGATNPIELDTEVGILPYLYYEQEGKFDKFSYNLGLRLTTFHNVGRDEVFVYENENRTRESIIDTLFFDNGEVVQSYYGLEPRAFLSYQFNEQSSLKASYSRNYQYLHLISNTISPSPTDIWKLSDTYIEPTISNQYSLGYYRNFSQNEIETSAEIYYRGSSNVIEFRDNADLLLNENVETEILFGEGRAFGLELFLKKNSGRFTGWVSYALAKSETRVGNDIPELRINSGEYFPNNFDQTHQFSATGIYTITDRLSISSNFIFATGKPTTLPAAKFELGGIVVPRFTERNKDRLPNYHRLDLSVKLSGKKSKLKKNGKLRKKQDYWTFSVYNLYSRRNVFSFVFRESTTDPGITEVVPFSVLGSAIPSVTYNFRF